VTIEQHRQALGLRGRHTPINVFRGRNDGG
jgi:hypothetical protein